MQEAPPDIQGFLEDQERHDKDVHSDKNKEEKDERASKREHAAEFYESDRDQDQQDGEDDDDDDDDVDSIGITF
ncbi:hypothetical protein IWW47_004862 [Coemansia sp. RSA 2052]|nr:hypothetical protein IWW47_004862 [Coemansia sp. RSA 2052]